MSKKATAEPSKTHSAGARGSRSAGHGVESVRGSGGRAARTPQFTSTRLVADGSAGSAARAPQLPINRLTKAVCSAAMHENADALQYVPFSAGILRPIQKEFCLGAVRSNGLTLRHVPAGLRTAELCLAAVQQNGNALQYVPCSAKTHSRRKICIAAVQQNPGALRHLSMRERFELLSEELCTAAVQQDPGALWYVPVELRSEKMRLAATRARTGRAPAQNAPAVRQGERQNGDLGRLVMSEIEACPDMAALFYRRRETHFLGTELDRFELHNDYGLEQLLNDGLEQQQQRRVSETPSECEPRYKASQDTTCWPGSCGTCEASPAAPKKCARIYLRSKS